MQSWGPLALLLVTIVNQLPVISVLMPIEPVYVYLGTQIADGAGWTSLLACVAGAWIGNLVSFWLGRSSGTWIVAKMGGGEGMLGRIRRLFDRWGAGFVVVAQLIWPIATLSQVMAGVWGMRPVTFAFASGLGALLAIAQYAAIGWVSAKGLALLGLQPEESLLVWLGPYLVLIGFVATLGLGAALILLRGRQRAPVRVAYVALLAVGMLIAVNLGTLTGRTDARTRLAAIPFKTACRVLDETLVARTGSTPLHSAQPVNLVLVGVPDPAAALDRLGWIRVRTYAGEPLAAWEMLWLTFNGLPPAASILLEGASTDRAWQKRRGTVPRTQLRLWPVQETEGKPPIYLGSVVQIDEVTLRMAGLVPGLAYDLWPATDEARDAEGATIAAAIPAAGMTLVGPGDPSAPFKPQPDTDPFTTYPAAVSNEFFSDGRAAEIRTTGSPSLTELCGSAASGN